MDANTHSADADTHADGYAGSNGDAHTGRGRRRTATATPAGYRPTAATADGDTAAGVVSS
jgi:hypothetical protein